MTDAADDTVRVSRTGSDVDDATVVSGRRGGSLDRGTGDTPDAFDEVAGSTPAPGPRRTPSGDPDPELATESATDAEPDGGSTVVARRESRRRQGRADAAASSPDPSEIGAAGVLAPPAGATRTPDAQPAVSPVRTAAPVIVARAAPVARAPQEVIDTAAVDVARRRRSRRRAVIVVVAASVVALVAAAALIILVTAG